MAHAWWGRVENARHAPHGESTRRVRAMTDRQRQADAVYRATARPGPPGWLFWAQGVGRSGHPQHRVITPIVRFRLNRWQWRKPRTRISIGGNAVSPADRSIPVAGGLLRDSGPLIPLVRAFSLCDATARLLGRARTVPGWRRNANLVCLCANVLARPSAITVHPCWGHYQNRGLSLQLCRDGLIGAARRPLHTPASRWGR